MKSILITGGAGFVGSHISLMLIEQGYKIFIIDNLINSSNKTIEILNTFSIKNKQGIDNLSFIKGDIRNEDLMRKVFEIARANKTPIDNVIHLASLKQVLESQKKPITYWENNLIGTINLLKIMKEFNCKNIIFSSSATVYSPESHSPIKEDSKLNPINTYGETKLAIEKLLCNLKSDIQVGWKVAILRYFNPIGAHPSGLIGENPLGNPTNLFPIICNVAAKRKDVLEIFGKDWGTKDGTCVRDYVHIMDIAEGHLSSLNYLNKKAPDNSNITINLGTGEGTSVLDLIKTFEKVNNLEIKKVFTIRRVGDNGISFADVEKAKKMLNWIAKRSLENMCFDGWNYIQKNFNL